MRKRNMLVDLSNLAWATRFGVYGATQTPNDSFSKERIMMDTLQTIVDCSKKFKATGILVACDSPKVWRRDVYPAYKMNRESEKDVFYNEVKQVVMELKDFFNSETEIPAISVPKCEADDIIYVANEMSAKDAEDIIISSDKDFVQLIDENTRLYSPAQKKERESEDPEYDLFLKCIRGDRGDNIMSAFPRVRETRLIEAWNDSIEMTNLMEHVTKDKKKVGDEFEFNSQLIDLKRIPHEHKLSIQNEITKAVSNQENNNYNMMGTIRFLRDNSMFNFAKNLNKYSDTFKMTYHMHK